MTMFFFDFSLEHKERTDKKMFFFRYKRSNVGLIDFCFFKIKGDRKMYYFQIKQ